MIVVVALGGNALARRGEPLDIEVQRRNVERAAGAVAEIARHHWVVLTHGNGPQVGLLALRNEAYRLTPGDPMDVLDAASEGMIGYLLEQQLGRQMCADRLATLLTQVVVDPADPGFAHPTKPVGPVYTGGEGARLARQRGWTMAPDGDGVRRVVPSPQPIDIVELHAIRLLLWSGMLVICVGGGGIPVVPAPGGGFRGVEAVVDKDRSAALLATKLRADALLLLTDVDAVYTGFGTPAAAPVRRAGVAELRRLTLPAGSMGPKVEAACRFAEGGGLAAIGSLEQAGAVLAGLAGTQVVKGSHPPELGHPVSGRTNRWR